MPSEYTLVVRRYAPFESFGGGFEGDNRQFSTSMIVTARTVGVVTFSAVAGAAITGNGYSDGSSYVGPWAVRKSHHLGAIGKHIGQVRVLVSRVHSGGGKVEFTVETSGNLPLKDVMLHRSIANAIDKANAWIRPGTPHPQGSPNIDTFLDFRAGLEVGHMNVEGVLRGDSFPNAEVFLLDARHNAAPLLDYQTSSGVAGPLWLVFSHPHTRRAEFRKQIPLQSDGVFAFGGGGPPITVRE
jgi:hypothetical protein